MYAINLSQGFLARLSGSTAEFLSMWNIMMAGPNPFTISTSNENGMCAYLKLQPILPKWLFRNTSNGVFQLSFTFLGSVVVTYFNPDQARQVRMIIVMLLLTFCMSD